MSTPLETNGQAILRIADEIRILLVRIQVKQAWTYLEPRVTEPEHAVEPAAGQTHPCEQYLSCSANSATARTSAQAMLLP